MVNIPTNYKMGSGLAATIMGQQAGLEAESQGLANLTKAMQMPQEALKGQEAAMLMQNPEYLQQKTANTLIELGNTYNANQFQQSLNEFGRVKLELQAATGNPEKQQQIVLRGLQALNMSPDSEFGQYALANPDKAIDQLIQGTEAAMVRTGGAKQLGAEKLAGIKGENALELAQARGDLQEKLLGKRLAATGGGSTDKYKYNRIAIEQRALDGDPAAQRQVNLWAVQKAQSQAGGVAIVQRPDGTFGIGQKGDTFKLPFPNAGTDQQTAPASTRPPLSSFGK